MAGHALQHQLVYIDFVGVVGVEHGERIVVEYLAKVRLLKLNVV